MDLDNKKGVVASDTKENTVDAEEHSKNSTDGQEVSSHSQSKGDKRRKNPVAVAPKHGWFQVHRIDLERIREYGESDRGTILTVTLIGVWVALVDLSNENRSETFKTSVGIIRKRAGSISRPTAFKALDVLQHKLRMLRRQQNVIRQGKKKHLDLSTYQIAIAGNFFNHPGKKDYLGKKVAEPRQMKSSIPFNEGRTTPSGGVVPTPNNTLTGGEPAFGGVLEAPAKQSPDKNNSDSNAAHQKEDW